MTTKQYIEYDAATKAGSNVERLGAATAALAGSNAKAIASGGSGMRGFTTPSVLDSTAADLAKQTRSLGERAEDTGTAVLASVGTLKGVDANGAHGFRKGHRDVDWELR